MAKINWFCIFLRSRNRTVTFALSFSSRALLTFLAFAFLVLPAGAQLQQPFVFAASSTGSGPAIAVYTRNDASGALTPVAGSPFPSREPVNRLALDFQGRFLFVATSVNNIEMFSIDASTGALQEVPNSPFASPFTKSPEFLSTESSGQFLYVVNGIGSQPNFSAIESFTIDPVNLDLVPSSSGSTNLPGLFVGGATHPSGQAFYVLCNFPDNSNPNPNEPFFLLFSTANGTSTTPVVLPATSTSALSLALDPQGLHVAIATEDQIVSQDLQLDGTLGASNVVLAVSGSPSLAFDPLGQFLYATLQANGSISTHFYASTMLQEQPDSPLSSGFPAASSWYADPTAPLIYADKVYQVDPQTGLLNAILSPSPLPPPFFQSAVFNRPPGSQPIVGPVVLLSSTSLSFGSLQVTQPSNPQTLTILSNGGQALSLNTFQFSGANSTDFTKTADTCHEPVVLQPGQSCSVLVSFTPSAAGPRSATFSISDNASPPIQSVQLSGTGLGPAPVATLNPANLNFSQTTQGTSTSSPLSVSNTGNAPLHISNVTITGNDANDFTYSIGSCNAAVSPNSSCTINVTFAPLTTGLRTSTIAITDDATGSPQIVQLQGNATAAFTAGPAPNGSATASISAGQTAQYMLQLSPGAGYSGTISLSCTGAPLAATCQVPATVTVNNGTPAPFTVSVVTTGASVTFPRLPVPPPSLFKFLLLAALLLWVTSRGMNPYRWAARAALAELLLCLLFFAGCGSAASSTAPVVTTPPPVVTPTGTSTITISMNAMSLTQQPLQLPPLQLTLTVK